MQSLSDLNNFGATTIDVEDDRSAGIIFTNTAGDAEYTTTEGEIIHFKDALGVEIEDIVDYANVNMEVEIELLAPFPDSPTLVYPNKPSYMTVSSVGAVTTIAGFRSVSDWLWLKNNFGIQNGTAWFGEFDYDVVISSDTNADQTFTASITVLDIGLLDNQADYQYTFTAFPSLQNAGDFIQFADPGSAPTTQYTVVIEFGEDYKFNIENVISNSSAGGGLSFDEDTKTVTINADREDTKEILENLQLQIANQFDIEYQVRATNNDSGETDYEDGYILFSTADTSLLADSTTESHDGVSFVNTGLPQITDTSGSSADFTYQINTLGNIDTVYYPNKPTQMTWNRQTIVDLTSGQSSPDYERYFDIDVSSDGETIATTASYVGSDSTMVYERDIEIWELVAGVWTKVFSANPVGGDTVNDSASGQARLSRNGLVAIQPLSNGTFDYFFKTNGTWAYAGQHNPGISPGSNIDINEDGTKILWSTVLLEYSNGSWSTQSTLPTGGNCIALSNNGNRVLREDISGNTSEWELHQWNGSSWTSVANDSFTYAATGITWNVAMNDVGDTVVARKSLNGLSVYYEDDSWAEEVITAGDTTGTSFAPTSIWVNNAGDQIIYGETSTNLTYKMKLWNESTSSWVQGNDVPLYQSASNKQGEQGLFNNLVQQNRASRDGQRFYVIESDIVGVDYYIAEVRTPITSLTNVGGVHTITAPKTVVNSLISNVEMEVNSSAAAIDFQMNILLETPTLGKTGKTQDVERI